MATVEEIEAAVAKLSKEELNRFVTWLAEFRQDQWDRQIAADSAAGKLDALAAEALRDYQNGRCTRL